MTQEKNAIVPKISMSEPILHNPNNFWLTKWFKYDLILFQNYSKNLLEFSGYLVRKSGVWEMAFFSITRRDDVYQVGSWCKNWRTYG